MSNDGSGHDPIIPFLWGALFASGSKSSSNASAGGGIVILILLAIVSVPLMPIILVAGVSVRALTIFGVHPVLIALTACAFAYWAFVLAGTHLSVPACRHIGFTDSDLFDRRLHGFCGFRTRR